MHIVKLLPEFMKVDLSLTREIERDPVKQALTAALVGFAAQIGAHLVAEGVETAEELQTLMGLGVEYAQGCYLGAPAPLPLRGVTERRLSLVEATTSPGGLSSIRGSWKPVQLQRNLPRKLLGELIVRDPACRSLGQGWRAETQERQRESHRDE